MPCSACQKGSLKEAPRPDQPGGGHDVTSSAVTNANQGPEIAGRGPRSTTHPLILIPPPLPWIFPDGGKYCVHPETLILFRQYANFEMYRFWQQSAKLYNLSVWPSRPGCEASPWKCNSLVSLFEASPYLFCSQPKHSFFVKDLILNSCLPQFLRNITFGKWSHIYFAFPFCKRNPSPSPFPFLKPHFSFLQISKQ